ncbi:MAG: hypothetical protein FWC40_10315 [Proteobacteria bacterium]|nr:hypothetical protein [Pseudomonadota bacterium]
MAKIQFEIVPNIYEIGLFRRTLSSRRRLRLTTLLATLALFGAFWGVGVYLRSLTAWPMVDIALILLLLGGALVGGYLWALTIGDVIFRGPWREKMLYGDRYVPEDGKAQEALLKNRNIYFILLWAVSLMVLIFGGDLVTGRHLAWYQETGTLLASMKSEDMETRRGALVSLTNPLQAKAWENMEVRAGVVSLLDDASEDIVALAAYVSSRALIVEGAQQLMGVVSNTKLSPFVRAEAATALGRMAWKPARGVLLTTLRQTFAENRAESVLMPAILFAFFDMEKDAAAVQDTMTILETCFDTRDCSDDLLTYAFFYLKSLRVHRASALAFRYFDDTSLPLGSRCMAADLLRFIATKDEVPGLKARFESTPSDVECGDKFRKYHAEAAIHLFERDPLRALLLRGVGNVMDQANYDWIWLVGSNEREHMTTRKVAEIYVRALDERRNAR